MAPISEPFPISRIADRYLLFDVDIVSHARREHNICGVLIGTIPGISQQNIFLGIPLELMPEEARVLVENGHAYIVDDVEAHRKGFLEMSREDRLAFMQKLDKQGAELAVEAKKKAEERTDKALKQKGMARAVQEKRAARSSQTPKLAEADSGDVLEDGDENLLFDSGRSASVSSATRHMKLDPFFMTPTTSNPPLAVSSADATSELPNVPRSYPLFKYLHSRGYFSTPGLRFGCHYTIYPGDPLRYHSHFLANGLDWDEEFDLLDLVGGGRLGTGVKKSFLVGGQQPDEDVEEGADRVRAFSIEWAGL